jgi:anhydro-N-acetylmuramic acid kinase
MSPSRLLVGLAVGSGLEGVDAAAVRVAGVGLSARPLVERHARTAFLPHVRDALRRPPTERLPRDVGDALATAARQAVAAVGADLRDVFAAGLILPPGPAFDTAAERVAEQTGLTAVVGYADRDRAAGGAGSPISPAADFLFARSPTEDRLLVHLGAVTSVLLVPAAGTVTQLVGFEAGPGNRFLDDLVSLGSRGREGFDPGGTKAVQGRCLDDVLADWLTHPFLHRKPPKAVRAADFAGPFVAGAFDAARAAGGSLHDLLCTAAHFVARCVGGGVRRWVPASAAPRGVYVSGGGVRNGFLWHLLQGQFDGEPIRRSDEIGLPALGRTAAAAAGLAALAADGVAGNLPLLTGAAGGRLAGRFVPGDPRNWAAVTAWAAEQTGDYGPLGRAA